MCGLGAPLPQSSRLQLEPAAVGATNPQFRAKRGWAAPPRHGGGAVTPAPPQRVLPAPTLRRNPPLGAAFTASTSQRQALDGRRRRGRPLGQPPEPPEASVSPGGRDPGKVLPRRHVSNSDPRRACASGRRAATITAPTRGLQVGRSEVQRHRLRPCLPIPRRPIFVGKTSTAPTVSAVLPVLPGGRYGHTHF